MSEPTKVIAFRRPDNPAPPRFNESATDSFPRLHKELARPNARPPARTPAH